MSLRPNGPVPRHTRSTEAIEYNRNDLEDLEKQQRRKKAKDRKAALGRFVQTARDGPQPPPRNKTTRSERAASASEHQLQDPLASDSINEPPAAIPDADPALVFEHFSRRFSTPPPPRASPDAESLSTYYKRTGYLPPLSESTLEVIHQVLMDPTIGPSAGRITTELGQQMGLDDRNVNWDACSDPYVGASRLLRSRTIPENWADENKNWENDVQKCTIDPQEFVFQRTVMMSLINRHRFIYADGLLDFAVERPWTCSPMPTRALGRPGGKRLPQSQPDMAIAFHTTALIGRGHFICLPPPLRNLICYEGLFQTQQRRAFHFFMIEAKNKSKGIDDQVAQYQVLNSASQSLHNMFEFFNEAGPEHLADFFDKVRVFTAVSTAKGILIRIHRAFLAAGFREEHPPPGNFPDPMVPIIPSYPLQFEYDTFFEASLHEFTYEDVVPVLGSIMIEYGVGELLGLLKRAANDVVKKFIHGGEQRSPYYYSHYQEEPRFTQRGRSNTSYAGRIHAEQNIPTSPRFSHVSIQSASKDPDQRKLYRENIEQMHNLNKARRSRAEDITEHDSPTPTPPTREHTASPDPNASISENFEARLNVNDPTGSQIGQPGPATIRSHRNVSRIRQRGAKRNERPGSERGQTQPVTRSPRSTRSTRSAGVNKRLRPN